MEKSLPYIQSNDLRNTSSMQIHWDCSEVLIELGSQNKLTLVWITGYRGHTDNEKADTSPKRDLKGS